MATAFKAKKNVNQEIKTKKDNGDKKNQHTKSEIPHTGN